MSKHHHSSSIVLLSALAIAAATSSCLFFDPVQTDKIDALGGEINNERPGPTHRAGQPCTVCHSPEGTETPHFTVAGTVYDRRGSTTALEGVTVSVTDVNNATFTTTTNRVGNFYVTTDEWAPTFPLFVELQSGAFVKLMKTRIGRDGGCGQCHQGTAGDAKHMPAVYLKELTDP